VDLDDRLLPRIGWSVLVAAGHLAGPRAARPLAVLLLRAAARTERGWLQGLHRVARTTSGPRPDVVRLPEAWSSAVPRVHARRLGLALDLDLRDNLQRVLWWTGTYEPALLAFVRAELRQGDVVADVGAHIGVHALTAALRLRTLGGGRVLAFEPARDSADRIRAAALAVGLDVEVVETALGREDGTVGLFADPRYGEADAGVRSQHGQGRLVQTVPVTTFDGWAERTGWTGSTS